MAFVVVGLLNLRQLELNFYCLLFLLKKVRMIGSIIYNQYKNEGEAVLHQFFFSREFVRSLPLI